MKAKTILTGLVLSTAIFGSQAMATESPIEAFLSHMVDQAVSVASNEIHNGVRQSVANATYNFSLNGEVNTGTVSVTDLAEVRVADTNEAASDE